MKKSSIILLSMIYLLGIFNSMTCYASSSAVVTGESTKAATGTDFEYRVSISGNPGLVAYGLRITYDTNALSLAYDGEEIDCKQGDFSSEGMLVCGAISGGCRVTWTHTANVASDGTLFVLKLHVKDNAAAGDYTIKVQAIEGFTINLAEQVIPLSCQSGTVTVRKYQPLIYGETLSAKQGESVDFAVSVQDNPGIASCGVLVQFDPDVLTLEPLTNNGDYAVKSQSGITQGTLVSKVYANEIEVLWSHAYGANHDGALFLLRFRVKDYAVVGEHTVTVSCVADNTCNTAEQPVEFASESGVLTVKSALVVDVGINHSHEMFVTIQHSPAKYAVIAFYDSNKKLLAVDMKTINGADTSYTVQNSSVDFTRASYKVMFLSASFCPVSECYTSQ